jgi:CheY-like chemotaxis protein
MNTSAEIHAFVVADLETAGTFVAVFRELEITPQVNTGTAAVVDELDRTKFEALVLDFDKIQDSPGILERARANPANKSAVVFAVASDAEHRQQAITLGANFVFERPFALEEIRDVFHAARDLMVRERRRYFRCSAELPVWLVDKISGTDLECSTMNISRSGMAVVTPLPLSLGAEIEIKLFLSSDPIRATGTVVWDDKHGKSGISFRCITPKMQSHLDAWLNAQFFKVSSTNIDRSRSEVFP